MYMHAGRRGFESRPRQLIFSLEKKKELSSGVVVYLALSLRMGLHARVQYLCSHVGVLCLEGCADELLLDEGRERGLCYPGVEGRDGCCSNVGLGEGGGSTGREDMEPKGREED